mmetsp:Transcript_21495/g.38272  ORF Transcript_21495/g.38272 Transcript_21495/m.38272 type:complete len:768 (-) Transcript_21495:106-2409(-)
MTGQQRSSSSEPVVDQTTGQWPRQLSSAESGTRYSCAPTENLPSPSSLPSDYQNTSQSARAVCYTDTVELPVVAPLTSEAAACLPYTTVSTGVITTLDSVAPSCYPYPRLEDPPSSQILADTTRRILGSLRDKDDETRRSTAAKYELDAACCGCSEPSSATGISRRLPTPACKATGTSTADSVTVWPEEADASSVYSETAAPGGRDALVQPVAPVRLRSRRFTFAGDDGQESFEDYLAGYADEELETRRGNFDSKSTKRATSLHRRATAVPTSSSPQTLPSLAAVRTALATETTEPPTAAPKLARSLSRRLLQIRRSGEQSQSSFSQQYAAKPPARRASSGDMEPEPDYQQDSGVFDEVEEDRASPTEDQAFALGPRRLTFSKSLTVRGRRASVHVPKPQRQTGSLPQTSSVFDDVEDFDTEELKQVTSAGEAPRRLMKSTSLTVNGRRASIATISSPLRSICPASTSLAEVGSGGFEFGGLSEPSSLPSGANLSAAAASLRGRRATISGEVHPMVERVKHQVQKESSHVEESWPWRLTVHPSRRRSSVASSDSGASVISDPQARRRSSLMSCDSRRSSSNFMSPFEEGEEEVCGREEPNLSSRSMLRSNSLGTASERLSRISLGRHKNSSGEEDMVAARKWSRSSLTDTISPCGSPSPRGFFSMPDSLLSQSAGSSTPTKEQKSQLSYFGNLVAKQLQAVDATAAPSHQPGLMSPSKLQSPSSASVASPVADTQGLSVDTRVAGEQQLPPLALSPNNNLQTIKETA